MVPPDEIPTRLIKEVECCTRQLCAASSGAGQYVSGIPHARYIATPVFDRYIFWIAGRLYPVAPEAVEQRELMTVMVRCPNRHVVWQVGDAGRRLFVNQICRRGVLPFAERELRGSSLWRTARKSEEGIFETLLIISVGTVCASTGYSRGHDGDERTSGMTDFRDHPRSR